MWPVILAEPVNHHFCVFGPIVRELILQFAHVDSLNAPMWVFAWTKLQPTQSEWARPRCVIQSMQTWRLSLAFPQTQPFKSLQSPRTQNPHAESLKTHTHKNSCKRRKDNEVYCGGTVSHISPSAPHPELAHAGSQLLGEHRENIHPQERLK